jgi:peptidyl-prolyl cis-trans isomerase B (cyclophilin B)
VHPAVRLICLALCVACCASAARAQQPETPKAESQATPSPSPAPKKVNVRPPDAEPGRQPEPFDKATVAQMAAQCVTLDTEAGRIEIEMLAEVAPETARNFLNLAATGAYDTTVFSRVVKGFIIQGGDLATRERVNIEHARRARRTVPDEPNAVKHVRGVVSMARTDEPNSATTHFFILVGTGAHLDGTFAAFGRVRSGMDAADKINGAEVEGDAPKQPVRITRATVAPCAPPAKPQTPAESLPPRP